MSTNGPTLRTLLATFCVAAVAIPALAGQPLQTIEFTQTMTIDRLGDCAFDIGFSLTAMQFANWNQKYGQNKSLIKRDVGKLVSQYDTSNWDVKVNEMERKVSVTLKARGAVAHRGGGVYELPIPKNWKGGQQNGGAIDFNYIESIDMGVVGQYAVKVILPAEAVDVKDTTGESGERVVRYTVPSSGGGARTAMLIGGIAALAIGLVMSLLGLRKAVAKVQAPAPAGLSSDEST